MFRSQLGSNLDPLSRKQTCWPLDPLHGPSYPSVLSRPQARPLSTMGFSTSRTLDPSGGHDTKLELSMALSRKMCDIERKKRIEIKRENWVATDRLRDDIRYLKTWRVTNLKMLGTKLPFLMIIVNLYNIFEVFSSYHKNSHLPKHSIKLRRLTLTNWD